MIEKRILIISKLKKYLDHNVEKLADIQFTQAITDDPIQPDSSADGMVMVQKLSSQDESEIIHQSEVVECEIISENISGKVLVSSTANNNKIFIAKSLVQITLLKYFSDRSIWCRKKFDCSRFIGK